MIRLVFLTILVGSCASPRKETTSINECLKRIDQLQEDVDDLREEIALLRTSPMDDRPRTARSLMPNFKKEANE